MTHYSVPLPTKGYLCQYLLTLYSNNATNTATTNPTILIDPASDFGDLIITKLASQLHSEIKPTELDARLYRMDATVRLKLPIHYFRKLPNKELTRHQIIRINRTIENMFEKDLCDVVARAHDFMGINRQVAIECFAANHGIVIEQHITFEALKKMEYRFRRENARHTVRNKIVRELSGKIRAA